MSGYCFTSIDLYCLAYLCGKTKIYGLPDPLYNLADEQKSELIDATINTFLERGILIMDFDGNQSLHKELKELVAVFSDCDECLTVNISKPDIEDKDLIVWKKGDAFYLAQLNNAVYTISVMGENEIRNEFCNFYSELCESETSVESTVLNMSLVKASRAAEKGDMQEALRILKQDGVSDSIASVVVDGMQKKASYLGCLLIEISKQNGKTEKYSAFLCSRNKTLHLTQRYCNLRNCTAFGSISKVDAVNEINCILDAFFSRKEAL